ncbi:hypothetical protein OIV83_004045 [Microbotryomycetes sp. JL201]|nr:hypothetical protein OIV83_004045 [Microbotryomycetes sp. JL201]
MHLLKTSLLASVALASVATAATAQDTSAHAPQETSDPSNFQELFSRSSLLHPFSALDNLLRFPDWTDSVWPFDDSSSRRLTHAHQHISDSPRRYATAGLSTRVKPAMDCFEQRDNIVCEFELAGMTKQDVDVSLHDSLLTVSGSFNKQRESESDGIVSERRYGSFSRTFSVPSGVQPEDVEAKMNNGLLTVTIPRKAKDNGNRKIAVLDA